MARRIPCTTVGNSDIFCSVIGVNNASVRIIPLDKYQTHHIYLSSRVYKREDVIVRVVCKELSGLLRLSLGLPLLCP